MTIATLLDKLIVAMDAAEDNSAEDVDLNGVARRVQIVLAHGCLIAVATIGDRVVERRMSLDMVEDAFDEDVCRDLVEQAVQAL